MGKRATPAKKTKKLSAKAEVAALRPTIDEKTLGKLVAEKPKSAKARKHLLELEPQVHEATKMMLVSKGNRCSRVGAQILKDLAVLRKPYTVSMGRLSQPGLVDPWKDHHEFEFLGKKHHCSLFTVASTTKSRPLRLFMGRLFDWKLYDLMEFDVVGYTPMRLSLGNVGEGSKPVMLFQGAQWEQSPELLQAKNVLADVFGGVRANKLYLEHFDRAITCTIFERSEPISGALQTVIQVCQWGVSLYKDNEVKSAPGETPLPKVRLTFLGPSLLLRQGTCRLPEKADVVAAKKIPDELFVKGKSSVKTVTDGLRQTKRLLHLQSESLKTIKLRHGKKK